MPAEQPGPATVVFRDLHTGETCEVDFARSDDGAGSATDVDRTYIDVVKMWDVGTSEGRVHIAAANLAQAAGLLGLEIGLIAECVGELEIDIVGAWTTDLGPFRRATIVLAGPRPYGASGEDVDPYQFYLRFEFEPDLLVWNRPWGVQAVLNAIEHAAAQESGPPVEIGSEFGEENYFWCDIRLSDDTAPLAALIHQYTPRVEALVRVAHGALLESHAGSALTEVFAFPEPLRSACEQYLLYFTQFLRDLGIDAEAGIREEAGQVLFTVRPADGVSALGRIREALTVYLDFPSNPEFGSTVAEAGDVAARQLQANVLHLQSQVVLAQALLQAKDTTIEALQLSNLRLRQLGAASPRKNRVDLAEISESTEPLLGKYVSVRPVQYRGLAIDLPALLRNLKRRFR
jgi:hypothetical protein